MTTETAQPVATEAVGAAGQLWPELAPDHPLLVFHSKLGEILSAALHTRIWGIALSPASPPEFTTLLVLQKYLRSNSNNVGVAAEKLAATLKWRKEFGLDQEGSKAEDGVGAEKFRALGYVTTVRNKEGIPKVVCWNIYGAVKNLDETFGDLDHFIRWRVNLMEQSVARLSLATTRKPIPDLGEGPDPHQMVQVHDYLSVSFLRPNPHVKAASKATITLLAAHYPELLERKLFVNVPYIMGWVFSAVKLFVKPETVKKFVVLSEGNYLADELGNREDIPKQYGGTGGSLVM